MKKLIFSLLLLPLSANALPLVNVHLVMVGGAGAIQTDIPTLFAATKESLLAKFEELGK